MIQIIFNSQKHAVRRLTNLLFDLILTKQIWKKKKHRMFSNMWSFIAPNIYENNPLKTNVQIYNSTFVLIVLLIIFRSFCAKKMSGKINQSFFKINILKSHIGFWGLWVAFFVCLFYLFIYIRNKLVGI